MWVTLEIYDTIQLYDGDIVVQVARRVLRVGLDVQHVELNVGVELAVVVDVPLSYSDTQLLRPDHEILISD